MSRLIRRRHLPRLLYVDFEGRKDEVPVLLGLLYAPDPEAGDWTLRQFVFDEGLAQVDRTGDGHCEATTAAEALEWLIDLSDQEARQIVSWSSYDREVIKELTDNRAFRWRNAIATAKRWRRRQVRSGLLEEDGEAGNPLSRYEGLIGYVRPPEQFSVGASIGYIRERRSITPGVCARWEGLVEHNRHDLLAMRAVIEGVFG